tara:strand:+ start:41 stop:238 length:198 start_codon:yes stop_codon:yes gene_type:complete
MRSDYTSKPGTEDQPIEKAMTIFVEWAKKNNRSYFSDMVKQTLSGFLSAGHTPESAVQALIKKAP